MAAEMALPLPGKMSRQASRAELGDRIFVVGGKLLLLLLLSVAVLMPLLAGAVYTAWQQMFAGVDAVAAPVAGRLEA